VILRDVRESPRAWFITLPIRLLVLPFILTYCVLFSRFQWRKRILLRSPTESPSRWFFTLPIRAVIAPPWALLAALTAHIDLG
jgi:hypothetical protein